MCYITLFMATNKTNRRLKVQSKYINNNKGYYYSRYKDSTVPFIPLSGLWLENAKFEIGCFIDVQVNDECLIIRKIKDV